MKDRNELICICMEVRLAYIEDAIVSGNLKTVDEIGDATEAGTSCGACHDEIEEIIREVTD